VVKPCSTCKHFVYVYSLAPVELTICAIRENGQETYTDPNNNCEMWEAKDDTP
jgi:hypothetical protein